MAKKRTKSEPKTIFFPVLSDVVIMVQRLDTSTSKDGLNTITLVGERRYPFDVDRNGSVDLSDLVLVGKQFGQRIEAPSYINPDVNRDRIVDVLDLMLVEKHFGDKIDAKAKK